ncbi:15838_t:CDS:2 [Cetraspora pellucida]|uniref:15838_t:CDS:1 n=1 Tax=Cetraspora pellucida TaxID=1433469 RepID=A0ACA9K740_9GLOM|nr:15838_t:CDS:2 [Cetraspora pellucida]
MSNTIHIPYFFDNNKITTLNRSSIESQSDEPQEVPIPLLQSQTFLPQNNLNHVDHTTAVNNLSLVDPNVLETLSHNQATAYHKNIAAVHAQYLSHLSIPNSGYMLSEDFTRQEMEKITASCNTSQLPLDNQPTLPNPVNQKPSVYTKWTEQEDELLREAVQRYGPHKWSLIATHVPNRTPMQCSARWVGALNPSVLKGRWTSVEDVALTETVSRYLNAVDSQGNPQPIPWNKVSKQIPQRTGAQCQARWTEALDPRIKKGKWSPSEDSILKEGVKIYGRCWIRIAEMIQGRTQRQCRTRWLQIKNKLSKLKNNESNIIMSVTPTVQSCDINPILTPPITPSTSAQQIKVVQAMQHHTGSFGPTNIALFEANGNPVGMFPSPTTPGFQINVNENLFSNYTINPLDNQITYHNSPEATALCFYNVYNNNNAYINLIQH